MPLVSGPELSSHSFLIAACVPREGSHTSGTLAQAEAILQQHPEFIAADIYIAAALGDEKSVRHWLVLDPSLANAEGGPYGWDALTYLCFSRYLRLDRARSEKFVAAAQALLDAGAHANTGWWEENTGEPRAFWESAVYGAAGVAHHAALTELLLARGADPNDEETPYHVPESHELDVLRVILASKAMTPKSLAVMLLRKADWHDRPGIRMLLEAGADPNRMTRWGFTALHQALRRDNAFESIDLMLQHGADFSVMTAHDQLNAFMIAANRGRGDVLQLLDSRGVEIQLEGLHQLIALCALGNVGGAYSLASAKRELKSALLEWGGSLLAEFAGNDNANGLQLLLDLGLSVHARYQGDGYFGIAPNSTALHGAAWRLRSDAVKLLIARGVDVNAVDAWGRTALMLAVKACTDSYWSGRRTPEIVEALLHAGASKGNIKLPCGYAPVDALLSAAAGNPA